MVVEYASVSDKQRKYVQYVLPLVFAAALRAFAGASSLEARTPRQIHDWVRYGRYVAEFGPRDEVRDVAVTLAQGGDCEDWTAVQLWQAAKNEIPARVVTAGKGPDDFLHVYVEFFDGGRWVASNPKGNQTGMDYGEHSDWPVKRRWGWQDGRLVELDGVEGSAGDRGCEVRGSGVEQVNLHAYFRLPEKLLPNNSYALKRITFEAPPWNADPTLINSWRDWWNLFSDEQDRWFWKSLSYGEFGPFQIQRAQADKVKSALIERLDHGTLGLTRGQLLHWTRSMAISDASDFRRIHNGSHQRAARAVAALDPAVQVESARNLQELNTKLAGRWAAGLLEEGEGLEVRRKTLRDFAISVGAKPDGTDQQLASVAAAYVALTATARGVALDDVIEAQRVAGDQLVTIMPIPAVELPAAAFGGSGKNFFKAIEDGFRTLIRHPLKWARRVFVTEVGKGIAQFADNILAVDQSVPLLSQFLLRPLGFMAQAQVLKQLGAAMIDGSVSTFDEKAVALETGQSLTAAGTALVSASAFIPQPWGAAALAVGALMIAGGQLIVSAVHEDGVLKTGVVGQDRVAYIDEFGRETDADGLPLDPLQRQAELQKRADQQAASAVVTQQPLAPDPATQVADEWRQAGDGLFYGWHGWNTQSWYWTALQVDQAGAVTAAWVWTENGWEQVA